MQKTASDYSEFVRPETASDSGRSSVVLPVGRLKRLAREWVLDGEIRGLTTKSLRERRDVVEKLLWLAEREEWTEIGSPETAEFLSHVRSGHTEPKGRWGGAARDARLKQPPSASTLMAYFRQLRCLNNWLAEEGAIQGSLLGRKKPPLARPPQVTPFSEAQVEALLAAARRSTHPKRDEAIVLFLSDTGCRAAELCGLDQGDLDLPSHRARLRATKGGRSRNVYFGKRTTKALYGVLFERRNPDDPKMAVFASDRGTEAGERLSTSGLFQLVQRLGQAAKIEGVRCSPHTFRHFYSISFLRAGGSLFSLQQALGHSSLAMVRRYVAWAEADLEKQAKAFSPADRLKR